MADRQWGFGGSPSEQEMARLSREAATAKRNLEEARRQAAGLRKTLRGMGKSDTGYAAAQKASASADTTVKEMEGLHRAAEKAYRDAISRGGRR